jgi:hypothetical protein
MSHLVLPAFSISQFLDSIFLFGLTNFTFLLDLFVLKFLKRNSRMNLTLKVIIYFLVRLFLITFYLFLHLSLLTLHLNLQFHSLYFICIFEKSHWLILIPLFFGLKISYNFLVLFPLIFLLQKIFF